jgi:hypothetical protein
MVFEKESGWADSILATYWCEDGMCDDTQSFFKEHHFRVGHENG